MNYVSSGEACKFFHISYVTLQRWRLSGKLNCKVYGLKKILYDIDSLNTSEQTEDNRLNVVYARVSTTKQKQDLNNQVQLIKQYMLSTGILPDYVYQEIASGLNENRAELNKLMQDIKDNKIKTVYITYKDRLTRFGFNYFKYFFKLHNVDIIVLDKLDDQSKDATLELTEDLISIIHHYSTKLYSNRKKQMKEIQLLLENNLDK